MINKKTIGKISGGLVALVLGATIALKDNVYLGSVALPENSKGNQYALGILPEISASGTNITGNHYSVGLFAGKNDYAANSVHTGNSTGIGLLGGGNKYAANSVHTGNITSVSLFLGVNDYTANSVHIGNSTVRGILSIDKEGKHFLGNKILKTQERSAEDSK